MSIYKKIAVRVLPGPVLRWMKAIYYAKVAPKFWEPDVEPLKCLVQKGDRILHLGANIGEYTCLLANLAGENGRVCAVEPIPETFEVLSSVIRRLGLRNVELINCAISEKDGSVVMEVPLHEYGGDNFYMAHIVSQQASSSSLNRLEIPCRSLDSLLVDYPEDNFAFIKCDVEGHELEVVKGAVRLFEKSRPAMMIEVAGTAKVQDAPDNEFYLTMRAYGYKPYWFDGKHLRERTRGQWSVNYFFLQPSHIEKVSHLLAN